MTAFQRKVALRIVGIHIGIILFIMMISGLKGCFRPKPKPEIVTFIEFGQAAPPVAVQQVEQMENPTPDPAPQPDPTPAPLPDPVKKPIPKPTPKKEVPKPKPKPEPEKPKWKPTDPTKIKIGKKVEAPKPVKPAVSTSEIQKALKNVQSSSPTASKPSAGPVGNPNADNAYISQIGNFFDQRWTKPDSSSPSASAVVRIYISKWGTITRRTKIQGSGDAAFDASVMSAVNSVSTVPKPPSGFSYEYVEVEFRVRN
ncbi:TonB family protein [Pontiellaceae bacterium B12227]|nr:TonB family protein [Pontiellaceae bacterium B12227]